MYLIYGLRTRATPKTGAATHTARCPACRSDQQFLEVIGNRHITFFFVPVIPVGAKHMHECQGCRALFLIPNAPPIPDAWSTGRIPRALSVLVGLPIGLIGLLMFVGFAMPDRDAGWTAVDGQVSKAEIVDRQAANKGKAGFFVEVDYEYALAGKPYRGKHLEWLDRPFWTREDAAAALGDIKAGTKQAVYVNPEKPEEAELRKSETSSGVKLALYGIAGVVVAIGFGLPVTVFRIYSGAS